MGLNAKDSAALLARSGAARCLCIRDMTCPECRPPRPREPGGDFTAEGAEALEAAEQRALAKVLDAAGLLWNHCPNEGKRPGRSGGLLVAAGLKRGFPDVQIFDPAADGRETVLELKRVGARPKRPLPDGVPPWAPSCFTAEQKWWLERLKARGRHALVAYGAEDAVRQLRALGYALGEVGG